MPASFKKMKSTPASGASRQVRLLLLTLLRLLCASEAMAIEEPKFTLVEKDGPMELRLYQPRLWRVCFTMPAQYTLETLPRPVNPQVMLRELPETRVAALVFSETNSEEKTREKSDELVAWMAKKNLAAAGKPELARYKPPWTLPFWRRNEILIPCR